MKQFFLLVLTTGAVSLTTAQTRITVSNSSSDNWKDAPVVVAWNDGLPGAQPGKLISAKDDDQALPVQADDLNGDGKTDELVLLIDLKAGTSKTLTLQGEAPEQAVQDRAHAGMYLKSAEMKGMEGPGWESDEIAYRLYWDERNAVDVFCKVEPILSLDGYARKDVDYHRFSKYGMDVLKVGKAVGIGGFGVWLDGKVQKVEKAKREHKVVVNGPIRTVTDLIYSDWEAGNRKLNLVARMITYGGQPWAEAQLTLKVSDGQPLPQLVTGIVRHEDTELVKDAAAGLVGRWGKQALGEGEVPKSANLGLGVVTDSEQVAQIGEDEFNTHLVLKSKDGKASYRYNANWEKEPDAAASAQDYEQILRCIARLKPVVTVESGSAQ